MINQSPRIIKILFLERPNSIQDLRRQYRKAINIRTFRVRRRPLHDLWGHIQRGPEAVRLPDLRLIKDRPRRAKVRYLARDLRLRIEPGNQDIIRLDVPVDDALRVQEAHPHRDVPEDLVLHVQRQRAVPQDGPEAAHPEELEDDRDAPGVDDGAVQLHHVGAPQEVQHLDLPQRVLPDLGVLDAPQRLDGDDVPVERPAGDRPEAPDADVLLEHQRVVVDQPAGAHDHLHRDDELRRLPALGRDRELDRLGDRRRAQGDQLDLDAHRLPGAEAPLEEVGGDGVSVAVLGQRHDKLHLPAVVDQEDVLLQHLTYGDLTPRNAELGDGRLHGELHLRGELDPELGEPQLLDPGLERQRRDEALPVHGVERPVRPVRDDLLQRPQLLVQDAQELRALRGVVEAQAHGAAVEEDREVLLVPVPGPEHDLGLRGGLPDVQRVGGVAGVVDVVVVVGPRAQDDGAVAVGAVDAQELGERLVPGRVVERCKVDAVVVRRHDEYGVHVVVLNGLGDPFLDENVDVTLLPGVLLLVVGELLLVLTSHLL